MQMRVISINYSAPTEAPPLVLWDEEGLELLQGGLRGGFQGKFRILGWLGGGFSKRDFP